MNEYQKVVTLSIGGNNVGFGRVLRACVFKAGGPISDDCDETIQKVREERLIGNKLVATVKRGYRAVTSRLFSGDQNPLVLVQLYPNFFVETSHWCDSQTMGFITGSQPRLTKELRRKLNGLGNDVRREIIRAVAEHRPYTPANEKWIILDETDNEVYPGHCFCEEHHQTLDNEEIWFSNHVAKTRPPCRLASTSMCLPTGTATRCATWDYLQRNSSNDNADSDTNTLTKRIPVYILETIIKGFHPKSAAFKAISHINYRAIVENMRSQVPDKELKDKVGDERQGNRTTTSSGAATSTWKG
ncbi:hypothetical protein FBEOM_11218 [Fusarium beomiforme]|uniref:Uncharacterized protein n=1 Tax=Fusarium beomiforme TaxID=44412 RepID=A0A9P5DRY1_9HYPO|nr:hypothetical protein FBEOM_11218 [Fusarium beomiforme]